MRLGFSTFHNCGHPPIVGRARCSFDSCTEEFRDRGGLSAVDIINTGKVDLVINTPLGRGTRQDGWLIRTAAVQRGIPIITTIAGFKAAVSGITELNYHDFLCSFITKLAALGGKMINVKADQIDAEVISNKRIGAYNHMVFAVMNLCSSCRPGNFAAIAVGVLVHR